MANGEPGDDGGTVFGPVKWEVETEDDPIEVGCKRWYGIEARVTQDVWACRGFNYKRLYERARAVASDLCLRSFGCPAVCPNLRSRPVSSSWGCRRARVRFLWFYLNLFRAEARVRWAIGCETKPTLPPMATEPEPEPKDFDSPRPVPDNDGIPDPDHVLDEHHGFGGPPKKKPLPCNQLTTIRYTSHHDSLAEPKDYRPWVARAVDDAKVYTDSLWCDAPCSPTPLVGITRKEWSYDAREESVDIVLYITFMCTPRMPEMGPEDGKM
jgi:hypothetical protein